MAERQEAQCGDACAQGAANLALLTGSLVFGLIWYPYRILRDAGTDGIRSSILTYALAFVFGLFFFRCRPRVRWSWRLLALALVAGACNLGYVLATLEGEIVRVLLLLYLVPLWTVVLARALLGERLDRFGALLIALSLRGAATILWQVRVGLPLPQSAADWLGLGAGFLFALFNVLSRYVQDVNIGTKSMASFLGVVLFGDLLLLLGFVLAVANWVIQYGLVLVPANRAIVILLAEVGFAAFSAWWLAEESLGWREWSGGAMILAASVFSAKKAEKKNDLSGKAHG